MGRTGSVALQGTKTEAPERLPKAEVLFSPFPEAGASGSLTLPLLTLNLMDQGRCSLTPFPAFSTCQCESCKIQAVTDQTRLTHPQLSFPRAQLCLLKTFTLSFYHIQWKHRCTRTKGQVPGKKIKEAELARNTLSGVLLGKAPASAVSWHFFFLLRIN